MPIGLYLLLAASAIFLTRAASAGPALRIDRIQVSVRADATAQSRRIAVLRQGDEVEQTGSKDEWMRIRMSDGKEGWVHSALVQVPLIVQGRGVRIREAGSTAAVVLTTVSKGAELVRLGRKGDWYEVILADGRKGWVWSNLVRPKEITLSPSPHLSSSLQGATGKTAAEMAGLYAEALQLEKEGDYNSALDLFEEILREDPDHLGALTHAAQAHKQLRDYDDALKNLYAAQMKSPGRRDIMLELSEVYRLKELPDSTHKYQDLFRGKEWVPEPGKKLAKEGLELEDNGRFDDVTWIYIAVVAGFIVIALFVWGLRRPRTGLEENKEKKLAAAPDGAEKTAATKECGIAEKRNAGPAEWAGLDRQIEERWQELHHGSEADEIISAAVEKGLEIKDLERLRDYLDILRKALQTEEERCRIYADIVRLQEMKIEAMNDELRLRNREE